jgi:hypothetical protein
MPMQNRKIMARNISDRVLLSRFGQLDRRPPQFDAARARKNPGAECRSHQLRSKAEPKHRPPRGETRANDLDFVGQKWIIRRVINTDWPSHNNKKIGRFSLHAHSLNSGCGNRYDFIPDLFQDRFYCAGMFDSQMLNNDTDFAHGAATFIVRHMRGSALRMLEFSTKSACTVIKTFWSRRGNPERAELNAGAWPAFCRTEAIVFNRYETTEDSMRSSPFRFIFLAEHPDLIGGTIVTLVAVFLYLNASDLPLGTLSAPDAGFFPKSLSALLAVLGFAMMAQSWAAHNKRRPDFTSRSWAVPLAALVLIAYAALLDRIGFILCTISVLFLLMTAFGKLRWIVALAVSVSAVIVCYFGFTELGVPLPKGVLSIF